MLVQTHGGVSVHDIVNSKLKKAPLWGIDGYYVPVRETSKVVPWQAWNDKVKRHEGLRSDWNREENCGYIDKAIKDNGWVPAPKYDTMTSWEGEELLPRKGRWSKT